MTTSSTGQPVPERTDCHSPPLFPSVRHLNIHKYKWNTPSVRYLDVNHISMHNSCKYPNQSRGHRDETHCLSHRFPCLFLSFNIFGIEWDRNIIITVISVHLSHAKSRWPVFLIHKLKTATKWPCDCCNCTSSCQQCGCCSDEIYRSYHHLLTHTIIQIISIALKKKKCWFV